MTITNDSIGDSPAFPFSHLIPDNDQIDYRCEGMTYRQWLIGQALSGLSGQEWASDYQRSDVALIAITFANAIIEQLDQEAIENASEF
jgi:hypothetical protein